jgi:hypothetical protein
MVTVLYYHLSALLTSAGCPLCCCRCLHCVSLPLLSLSFHSSSSSRALVARRTAACAICLLASCVLAVILSRSSGDSKTALFDGYEGTWRPSGAKTGREVSTAQTWFRVLCSRKPVKIHGFLPPACFPSTRHLLPPFF